MAKTLRTISASTVVLLTMTFAMSGYALAATAPDASWRYRPGEKSRPDEQRDLRPAAVRALATSTEPAVVIMAHFTDGWDLMDIPLRTTSEAEVAERFFGTGGSTPSLAEYFAEVSDDRLEITPANDLSGTHANGVVNWIDLGQSTAWYQQNYGADLTEWPVAAAHDAVRLAFIQGAIDYSAYDMANDDPAHPVLDPHELHIFVILAAYEASASSTYLTPRVNRLEFEPVDDPLDGVEIESVALAGEIMWDQAEDLTWSRTKMGLLAHEFAHNLGLWDEHYEGANNVRTWCLMGMGDQVGNGGDYPNYPCAYARWRAGWGDVVDLEAAAPITVLPATGVNDRLHRIIPEGSDGSRFYLLENRQDQAADRFDGALPGSGLLVWDVTLAPDNQDYRALLVQADDDGLAGNAGDVFPGPTNSTALDCATTPAAAGASISNIALDGLLIHADAGREPAAGLTCTQGPVIDQEARVTAWLQDQCGEDVAWDARTVEFAVIEGHDVGHIVGPTSVTTVDGFAPVQVQSAITGGTVTVEATSAGLTASTETIVFPDLTLPTCAVSTTSLVFGILAPGQSATAQFTMTNTNPIGAVMSGSMVSSHGDYTVSPASYALAGGEQQTFTVTYAPSALAAHTATISTGTECGGVACSAVGTYIPATTYDMRSGTWTRAGSPYIVTGLISIRNPWGDGTPQWLHIEPGVTVMFMPGTGIRVGNRSGTYQNLLGAISAPGTEDEPIVFTAADGTSGGWTGLYTEAGSGHSVFEHCIIEKAVTNLHIGSPTCRHVTIRDASGTGVVGAALDSCLVVGNGGYGGSGGSYRHTLIEGNGGGGLASPGFVDSCRIRLNEGPGVSGYLNVHNSTIADNSGPAFAHPGLAGISVSGNTVSGNGSDLVEVAGGFTVTNSNLSWACEGVPIHVPGTIQVGQSTVAVYVFTVGAGTELLFDAGCGIQVGKWGAFGRHAGGSLRVLGTAEQPVRMGALSGVPGNWTGIYFDHGSVSSEIAHGTIEEATTAISCAASPPALSHVILARNANAGLATNAYASLVSCTVADNGSHNIVANGGIDLDHCLVAGSATGAGLQLNGGTATVACSNVHGNGGGNYVGTADPTGIDGNISENPEFCRIPGAADRYAVAESSPCAAANSGCGTIGARDAGCASVSDVPDPVIPPAFALHPCAPNPFNPATSISFDLPESRRVSLRVYDLAGRCVRSLLDGRRLAAGRHRERWDGRDGRGRQVAAGVYLYRLEAGSYRETRRMALVK